MAQTEIDNEHLLALLLLRPTEPAFMPKGKNRVIFDVPDDYMSEEFCDCAEMIRKRFAAQECIHIKVNRLATHPKDTFAFAKSLGRNDQFSTFLLSHQLLAAQIIQRFDDQTDIGDFVSLALYARDNLNPDLFAYAYSVAVMLRSDMRHVRLPSISGSSPYKFFGADVLTSAQRQLGILGPLTKPIISNLKTSSNLEPEQRISYFREDVAVNIHHWKWHLVYPFAGPSKVVNKDRRGELFYYMHQQMIARYNAERLSNSLGKVKAFKNFREPIPEAYFPKMTEKTSMRNYPARHANSVFRDVVRKEDGFIFDIDTLDLWRSRIYEAIDTGMIKGEKGSIHVLTEDKGMDDIGNLVESSQLSVNKDYYGNLHGSGHVAGGVIHDPDYAHLESWSVMGDVATACRDPFFYRWHAMVDELCQRYKGTLPPYGAAELKFDNIVVEEITVETRDEIKKDKLLTNWRIDGVDVADGLDFQAESKPVYIVVTHLEHKPFRYKINVYNTGEARWGTVRIFMAPTKDEDGNKETYSFNNQRTSFIEMDRFVMMIDAGPTQIKRSSSESSITISREMTFQRVGKPPKPGEVLDKSQEDMYFCGCGWPDHLLVPKGNCTGMEFDLFVMISDYTGDNVNQGIEPTTCSAPSSCGAPSFCGVRDKKYPDKRAMGFPFDRTLGQAEDKKKLTVKDFIKDFPNMSVKEITVWFEDKTEGETDDWYEQPEYPCP